MTWRRYTLRTDLSESAGQLQVNPDPRSPLTTLTLTLNLRPPHLHLQPHPKPSPSALPHLLLQAESEAMQLRVDERTTRVEGKASQVQAGR